MLSLISQVVQLKFDILTARVSNWLMEKMRNLETWSQIWICWLLFNTKDWDRCCIFQKENQHFHQFLIIWHVTGMPTLHNEHETSTVDTGLTLSCHKMPLLTQTFCLCCLWRHFLFVCLFICSQKFKVAEQQSISRLQQHFEACSKSPRLLI